MILEELIVRDKNSILFAKKYFAVLNSEASYYLVVG